MFAHVRALEFAQSPSQANRHAENGKRFKNTLIFVVQRQHLAQARFKTTFSF